MKKLELTQIGLIKEAEKMGIKVDLLEHCSTDNILLSKNGTDILFSDCGTPLDQLSYQAFFIAANKQYCKRLFEKLAIPHPKSIIFQDMNVEMDRIRAFFQEGQLYVCKPLDAAEGKGVVMHIKSMAQLKQVWNKLTDNYSTLILEEQKAGGDLRIQVIGGKMVAVCIREPAFVIGDGNSQLKELVEARRQIVEAQNPVNTLILDDASFELLEQQQLSLEDIPAKGQKVQLKYVANMNQGAVSTDITDEMHPDYNQWIEKISNELNLSIYALDVLTLDYAAKPSTKNAWALEINGQPYWYHHTFSEKRTHNIAKMILEDVFGA